MLLLTDWPSLVLSETSLAPIPPKPLDTPVEQATQLGWKMQPGTICGGIYPEIVEDLPELASAETLRLSATAGQLTFAGDAYFQGPVQLCQTHQRIIANSMAIERHPETKQVSQLGLQAGVSWQTPGLQVLARQATLQPAQRTGRLDHVLYRLRLRKQLVQSYAWGEAAQARQMRPGLIQLHQASYTSCPPAIPLAWRLKARRVVINRETGRGQFYHSWLQAGGIPILYLPWLDVPIDGQRHSGFLFPSIRYQTQSGYVLSVPWYWNIAANIDAILKPAWYTQRGLQFNGELRYLSTIHKGQFKTSYLAYDALTSTARYQWAWQHEAHWSSHLTGKMDVNWVGDDQYLEDFKDLPGAAGSNPLLQEARVTYQTQQSTWVARLSHYQTLRSLHQPLTQNPYNRLPDISFRWDAQPMNGLGIQLESQLSWFQRDHNPGEQTQAPEGLRFVLQPQMSWSLYQPFGYLISQGQLNFRHYALKYPVSGQPRKLLSLIPRLSVEGGIILTRDLRYQDQDYQQTLEPGFFYLYAPFQPQNAMPIFDSTLIMPFSFDQLFARDRFSGYDRQGDANQLSIVLSTRMLNAMTAEEKWQMGMGQIYYFRPHRVRIDDADATIQPAPRSSALMGQFQYHWPFQAQTHFNVAWDWKTHQFAYAAASFMWQPEPRILLRADYFQLKTEQQKSHRVGIAATWPWATWQLVVGGHYNLMQSHWLQIFGGVQYDSCCWAVRLLAALQSQADDATRFNRYIALQWQLKGLSTVGSNDINPFLTRMMPSHLGRFTHPFESI